MSYMRRHKTNLISNLKEPIIIKVKALRRDTKNVGEVIWTKLDEARKIRTLYFANPPFLLEASLLSLSEEVSFFLPIKSIVVSIQVVALQGAVKSNKNLTLLYLIGSRFVNISRHKSQ